MTKTTPMATTTMSPHVTDNAEQDKTQGTKPKGHYREDNDGAVSQRAAATSQDVAYIEG